MSKQAQTEYCAVLEAAACKLDEKPGATYGWLARFIRRVAGSLARPARIVLLGEANAGKSSLANLLIGEPVVPTSVVENSRFPIQFHYASHPSLEALLSDGRRVALAWSEVDEAARCAIEAIRVGLPVDRLKLFEVVDTPGGSVSRSIAARLSAHAQLACLPVWCTVAARAWKESERAAWTGLPAALRARALLAVTQTDLLPSAGDLGRVLDRLAAETAGLFAARVPIAIPDALSASVVGEDKLQDLWVGSGGEGLESVLTAALDDIAQQRVTAARRVLNSVLAREQQRNRLSGRQRAQPAVKGIEHALTALPVSSGGEDGTMGVAGVMRDPGIRGEGIPLVLRNTAGNAATRGLSELMARAS